MGRRSNLRTFWIYSGLRCFGCVRNFFLASHPSCQEGLARSAKYVIASRRERARSTTTPHFSCNVPAGVDWRPDLTQ